MMTDGSDIYGNFSSQSVDGKSYMSNETLKKYFGVGSFGHQNVVATTSGLKGILANILKEQTITEDIVKKHRRN